MSKRIFFTAAVLAYMAIPAPSQGLSLESKALIEEIRNRLQRRQTTVPQKNVSESIYIPGLELKNALARLRNSLYPEEIRPVQLPKFKSSDATISMSENFESRDEYIPGAQLAASLEKIRIRRDIIRMIKLIQATKAANHIPQISTAYSAPVEKENNSESPLSDSQRQRKNEDDSVETTAIHQERKTSAQLLKAADLKLHRTLTHKNAETTKQTKIDPEKIYRHKRNEDDDSDLNSELSKFEFKMPDNYRIRVQ